MRRYILLPLVFFSLAGGATTEDCVSPIQVSMTMEKHAVIAGEPITISLVSENTSKRPQIMGWAYAYLDDREKPCIDRAALRLVYDSGCDGSPVGGAGGSSGKLEPPGTIKTVERDVSKVCNLIARDIETLGSHLICYEPRSPSEGCRACVSFEIRAPDGLDREVFSRFPPRLRNVEADREMLGFSILEEYPTSTYAGYELWKAPPVLMYPFGKTVEEAVSRLSDLNFFSLLIPKDFLRINQGYENATPADYREAAETRAAVLRTFLAAHPDFARREILESKLAHLELALGNPTEAYQSWDWISKHGKQKEADRAAQFKTVMKAKGLIKD